MASRRLGNPEHVSAALADAAMERYARGDFAAFRELHDALVSKLYALALARTRDTAGAYDLVQETLLNIHKARATFRPGAAVAPWACKILNRLIAGRGRRRRWELLAAEQDVFEAFANGMTPEDGARLRECEQQFLRAWKGLPEQQREATQLICYGEISWAEAASLLGTSHAAVKLRVSRAKRKIRELCDLP